MKKILLALLFGMPLSADMKYDALKGEYYSTPRTPEIDIPQYHQLFFNCCVIRIRIGIMKLLDQNKPTKLEKMSVAEVAECILHLSKDKVTRKHIKRYLKEEVKTPTALRLWSDIKKNPTTNSILDI